MERTGAPREPDRRQFLKGVIGAGIGVLGVRNNAEAADFPEHHSIEQGFDEIANRFIDTLEKEFKKVENIPLEEIPAENRELVEAATHAYILAFGESVGLQDQEQIFVASVVAHALGWAAIKAGRRGTGERLQTFLKQGWDEAAKTVVTEDLMRRFGSLDKPPYAPQEI